MKYDFDIFFVVSADMRKRYASLAAMFGVQDLLDRELAIFRDPAATDALLGASECVRDCFVAAGFALNAFNTGVEAGLHFPDSAPGRNLFLSRLKGIVAALPDDADWNGFDIDAFFAAAETARPTSGNARIFARMTVSTPVRTEEIVVAAPPMSDFVFGGARNAA